MTTENNPIRRYAEGLALGAAEEQETARKAAEQCPECQAIGGHSVFCPRRPAPAYLSAPACECYSCDSQCGGTSHPDSCGPVEADAEGRPICEACRDMADVWGDHRTGLQAVVTQDRVRVKVRFGESAWLNPASARAFAVILLARADELSRTRAADASAMAEVFLTAPDADLERFDTEGLIRQLVAAALGVAPPTAEEQVAAAIARGLASYDRAKAEALAAHAAWAASRKAAE